MAKAAARRARERNARSYARRGPTREAYATVLIVCEGEKTEPNYFNELKRTYRLSNANIVVKSPDGTDPMTLVNFAEQHLDDEYDRICVVFDRNGHGNYHEALQRVANSEHGKAGKLTVVSSWPCFEFWILLHFKYTAQPFEEGGGRSSCDNVLRALRKHLPGYAKGYMTVFADLQSRLNTAIANAKRLAQENARTGSTNPATAVHELVEFLIGLKP